ncbi:uncharacterized protein BO88DRAFT_429748 [Aspergillus vadensis CBS 113365]|uniref:Zn(II)2Cys6 transcription factor n=1 Tax=Aspergillus vadensis (strain CBS 113365 / IMI 142717 / IBT 24658) TaxID=1448311 RepID=A0A319AYB2_ASPVC|nr:hypothetical protein BO88DRAFT_429748 [Aspergillus vadensis CBS 113365]PYH64411.1 hypothetical protein BO88DRAFT_429748 [Aspergillus vadensis CBS 113365]
MSHGLAYVDHGENTDSNIILAASKALSTSIMSRGSPERVSGVDSTHSYLKALKLMRKELKAANMSSDRELLASIMCLSLAEVMFPGPSEGLKMHIDAVAQILQANGPQRYQTGVAHRLFIGFRPLLMINAIQCRTPSFLGSDNWKTTPFAILSPSPMQSLLSQAAALPMILHTLDNLSGPDASDESQYECKRILNCFDDLLKGLNQWEACESNIATSPLYWYRDQDAEEIPCIWFPSITMANAITYIWAFRIICLCEMERLSSSLPQPSFEYLRILKEQHIESVQISSETLMRRICESMEYLLQDEMKLFGPASTILPLQVAYAVATMNGTQHNVELGILKRIVERLVLKGLQSFPMLIFGRNPFLHRWKRLSNR